MVFASTGGAIYGEQETFRPRKTIHSTLSLPTGSPSSPGSDTSTITAYSTGSLRRAALRQRLRATPGPARRGRGGGDLLGQPGRGQDLDDQRQWRADPRLRLRGRCRPRQRAGPRERCTQRSLHVGTAIETSVNRLRDPAGGLWQGRVPTPARPGEARADAQQRGPHEGHPRPRMATGGDLNTGLEKTLQFFAAP